MFRKKSPRHKNVKQLLYLPQKIQDELFSEHKIISKLFISEQ